MLELTYPFDEKRLKKQNIFMNILTLTYKRCRIVACFVVLFVFDNSNYALNKLNEKSLPDNSFILLLLEFGIFAVNFIEGTFIIDK